MHHRFSNLQKKTFHLDILYIHRSRFLHIPNYNNTLWVQSPNTPQTMHLSGIADSQQCLLYSCTCLPGMLCKDCLSTLLYNYRRSSLMEWSLNQYHSLYTL